MSGSETTQFAAADFGAYVSRYESFFKTLEPAELLAIVSAERETDEIAAVRIKLVDFFDPFSGEWEVGDAETALREVGAATVRAVTEQLCACCEAQLARWAGERWAQLLAWYLETRLAYFEFAKGEASMRIPLCPVVSIGGAG
ncbi:MAG: hypothetical protein JHD02_00050 [Thermoleophilaceae bacterium]|nr:hypothetical protein [Thermoleophilaceae bacterium]